MKRRRNHWAYRARQEYADHAYNLMVTFTMSPEAHMACESEALQQLARQGRDVRRLSAEELFKARCAAFGKRLTAFFKAVRKGKNRRTITVDGKRRTEHFVRPPDFRYLLVFEPHSGGVLDGKPHAHAIVHTNHLNRLVGGVPHGAWPAAEWYETSGGKIRAADHAWLRRQWSDGFTTVELCTGDRAIWYVCKYITKTSSSRVRASLGYGKTQSAKTD